MSLFLRTLKSVSLGHWVVFTLCLGGSLSLIWLKQIPERQPWGSEVGEFVNDFCLAIVTAYVFFFLTDLRDNSRKEHTYNTILGSPLNHLLNCYLEYAETLNISRTWANGRLRAPAIDYFSLSASDFKEIVTGLFYDNRPGQIHQGFTWLLEVGQGTNAKAHDALEQALSYKSVLAPEIAKCLEELKEGFGRMADVDSDMALYPPKYTRETFASDNVSKQAGIEVPLEIGGYSAILYRFVQANKRLFESLPLKDITHPILYDALMERLKRAHGQVA